MGLIDGLIGPHDPRLTRRSRRVLDALSKRDRVGVSANARRRGGVSALGSACKWAERVKNPALSRRPSAGSRGGQVSKRAFSLGYCSTNHDCWFQPLVKVCGTPSRLGGNPESREKGPVSATVLGVWVSLFAGAGMRLAPWATGTTGRRTVRSRTGVVPRRGTSMGHLDDAHRGRAARVADLHTRSHC